MSMTQVPRIVSAIYKAAVHINRVGPVTIDTLFREVYFGAGSDRMTKLRNAFEINWLCQTDTGMVDLTESTRKYFVPERAKKPYVGQKAPPAYRQNIFEKTLSKRFIPDRRGPRALGERT
jgi:hypothetical protein